jgi:hypothetical protein
LLMALIPTLAFACIGFGRIRRWMRQVKSTPGQASSSANAATTMQPPPVR